MDNCPSAQYVIYDEVPRYTVALRGVLGDPLATVDYAAAMRSRQELLDRARVGGVREPREDFAAQLLGDWKTASLASRAAYGEYLAALVAACRLEEAPGEAAALAALIWRALEAGLADLAAYRQSAQKQRYFSELREVVKQQAGEVDEAAVEGLIAAHGQLKRHIKMKGPIVGNRGHAGGGVAAGGGTTPPAFDAPRATRPDWAVEERLALDIGYADPTLSNMMQLVKDAMTKEGLLAVGAGTQPSKSAKVVKETQGVALAAEEPQGIPEDAAVVEGEGSPVEAFRKRRKELVNLRWFERWVASVQPHADDAVMTQAASLLLTCNSEDQLAAELFEILGERALDRIPDFLPHRREVLTALSAAVQKARQEELDASDGRKGPVGPSITQSVTVRSALQRKLEKSERKEARKKVARGAAGGQSDIAADLEVLLFLGWRGLVEVEAGQKGDWIEASGVSNLKALPKGTTRQVHEGWEEVKVPPTATRPLAPDEKLVPIAELEPWAQQAFRGYSHLNRIQSRIFPAAYRSNENLLVCAPTGAGKTNIAMICILREIGLNMRYGVIQKGDFKVVYVAPMKALAAEVTASFQTRLKPLGLQVRELTGDMQLSKRELAETQMIVTTPEKWDVITRKGGDVAVAALVKLVVMDEVHLLNDDRGPVVETLIARTLRQVEASQSMIRIVGLSATLPNHQDVAAFLGVNPATGLFYFDATYRPVPLALTFAGVSEPNFMRRQQLTTEVCYQEVVGSLRRGHQAMVFVHSRKDTSKTCTQLAELAALRGDQALFDCREEEAWGLFAKDVHKSRNRQLQMAFEAGFGIHHAGMLRPDRTLAERLFSRGLIKVLVCTATLAWGVNLPAHTVIIKGTQVYDSGRGHFSDLGMLDVQQIFGRAGRPQFDDSGEAVIITTHDRLAHYLGMLTQQMPIESQFQKLLVDNLNAEIVLGTVTNLREASLWLSYTYMYVRMRQNPLPYGVSWEEVLANPHLEGVRRKLITEAARELEKCKMARFDEKSGNLYVTELGRVASHFYINHSTIVAFNEHLDRHMSQAQALHVISLASEFQQVKVRDEELLELDELKREVCEFEVPATGDAPPEKVNVLLQAYVAGKRISSFSLTADMNYVAQNAPRICRGLFEIVLRRGWPTLAAQLLQLCACLELQLWPHHHPLRRFERYLADRERVNPADIFRKLEELNLSMERIDEISAADLGAYARHPRLGRALKDLHGSFPRLHVEATIAPITRTVLRVTLTLLPMFRWKDALHGSQIRWHVWVEDSETDHLYHSELWALTKKMMGLEGAQHRLTFTIPIFEPLPAQYYVRVVADGWLHAEALTAISFKHLILPDRMPPHTELLDLDPLPVAALGNPQYEAMYRFTHFNPIQTQAFHTLYHTDENVLLGAPTGSGKTISAELTMLRVFREHPARKVIYVAPLKALVRERISDWRGGLCQRLGKALVELTGDYTPDLAALLRADVIICTPEKWDGISRNWQARAYVRQVAVLIMDEIHLLGQDRGPILEVIVSRMRYIAAELRSHVRFVGLSTALANAQEVAQWLGVRAKGLFNFRPSVRPVPLEVHIQGYPGKFYCPRMAAMNKPCYAAIQTHSPLKPVLVFVSSRRQTRLTALDLIALAAAEERPRQFLRISEGELAPVLAGVQDESLRHCLAFGVGLHHAGLDDADRQLVERLFVEQHIQVLVATSTLAWGVNTPAHLVVVKGAEFYDPPSKRYVDMPITDVLQMMGRAGRPQFDQQGVAVVMVHEPKKGFYKKFLYEPFPVESSLPGVLPDHLGAEVAAGTVRTKQDAMAYLTWTYFYRRLLQNPSYYHLEGTEPADMDLFLSHLLEDAFQELAGAGCIAMAGEQREGGEGEVAPTPAGRIASQYYLQYQTMGMLTQRLGPDMDLPAVLEVLCAAEEYAGVPVRHNEEHLNAKLAGQVRLPVDQHRLDDPHVKCHLLLQAHLSRQALPITDYVTDSLAVVDNSLRLLQAIVDVAAEAGWLGTALAAVQLGQCIIQARWIDDPSTTTLPAVDAAAAQKLAASGVECLPQLLHMARNRPEAAKHLLEGILGRGPGEVVMQACGRLPIVQARCELRQGRGEPPPLPADGVDPDPADPPDVSKQPAALKLHVSLKRLQPGTGRGTKGSAPPRVHAPSFPKKKEEAWYCIVGERASGELLALRRISFAAGRHLTLELPGRSCAGAAVTSAAVYLLPDSYLGLDQEYSVQLA